MLYGAADAGAWLDTASLGTRGYRILGDPGTSIYSVAAAGDVNHDGLGDVLVGAYGAGSAGRATVVYGVPDVNALPANTTGGISALVPANLADSTRYVTLSWRRLGARRRDRGRALRAPGGQRRRRRRQRRG